MMIYETLHRGRSGGGDEKTEIILRAYAGKLTWIEGAEILGMSCRHLRRLRTSFEEHGFFALFDGRLGKTSPTPTPVALLEEVLRLHQEKYHDFNVRHFHEKLTAQHGIEVSYTWTKGVLQAGIDTGRALRELRIQLIAAYSAQARGRSERSFRTRQGRLPQELRIRDITDVDEANMFLRGEYTREFNEKFSVTREGESAFIRSRLSKDEMNRVCSIQHERLVNRDNTIRFANLVLLIEPGAWHGSLTDSSVKVYQHLDDTISIGYGVHTVGRFNKT